MIYKIEQLLQNTQLKQQVKESSNLVEAIKLIVNAGVQKGYSLTQENVAQVLSELILDEGELSESELLAVTGGLRGSAITGLSFYNCCW